MLVVGFVVKGFVGAADDIPGHASTLELIIHAMLLSFLEEELNGEGPVTDLMAISFLPNTFGAPFVENGFVGAAVDIGGNAVFDLLTSFF